MQSGVFRRAFFGYVPESYEKENPPQMFFTTAGAGIAVRTNTGFRLLIFSSKIVSLSSSFQKIFEKQESLLIGRFVRGVRTAIGHGHAVFRTQ